MALISFIEIINIVIAILGVGYIFTGMFPLRGSKKDILDSYTKGFDWSEFWFVCMVTAPAIILHEMGHKFVAMYLGLSAFFQVSYFGLFLGIILKLLGTGFIILAPGYVIISGATTVQTILSAFAGPFVNLLLWMIALLFLKNLRNMSRRQAIYWNLTKNINMWLFIFNMLPLPFLDGAKIWIPLFHMFF